MIKSTLKQLLTHDCSLTREIAKKLIARNFNQDLIIVKGISDQGKPYSIFAKHNINRNQINKILVHSDHNLNEGRLIHIQSSEPKLDQFYMVEYLRLNHIKKEIQQACDWLESRLIGGEAS